MSGHVLAPITPRARCRGANRQADEYRSCFKLRPPKIPESLRIDATRPRFHDQPYILSLLEAPTRTIQSVDTTPLENSLTKFDSLPNEKSNVVVNPCNMRRLTPSLNAITCLDLDRRFPELLFLDVGFNEISELQNMGLVIMSDSCRSRRSGSGRFRSVMTMEDSVAL